MPDNDLITRREACELLNRSPATVARYLDRGILARHGSRHRNISLNELLYFFPHVSKDDDPR
jgi:hypothetical protein